MRLPGFIDRHLVSLVVGICFISLQDFEPFSKLLAVGHSMLDNLD